MSLLRCDTIRDVILTCDENLTRVSWIYRTEPKTEKMVKKKKYQVKTDMLRSIGKQSGESVQSVLLLCAYPFRAHLTAVVVWDFSAEKPLRHAVMPCSISVRVIWFEIVRLSQSLWSKISGNNISTMNCSVVSLLVMIYVFFSVGHTGIYSDLMLIDVYIDSVFVRIDNNIRVRYWKHIRSISDGLWAILCHGQTM